MSAILYPNSAPFSVDQKFFSKKETLLTSISEQNSIEVSSLVTQRKIALRISTSKPMEGLEGEFFAISRDWCKVSESCSTIKVRSWMMHICQCRGHKINFLSLSDQSLVENFDSEKERLDTVFSNKNRLLTIDQLGFNNKYWQKHPWYCGSHDGSKNSL